MLKRREELVKQAEQALSEHPPSPSTKNTPPEGLFFTTGSTLLNLALSDDPRGGYRRGSLVNMVGDSSAGKTFLAWTGFAEALQLGLEKEYDFFYDEPERAFYFNAERLFGPKIPLIKAGPEHSSKTIQDFYRNTLKRIRAKKPFMGILDSLDSLHSVEDAERAKHLLEKGKLEGTFGTEKPKLMSEMLRVLSSEIDDTNSLLLIISQTRQNIGFGFEPKTRAGGDALRFYSTQEFWLSIIEKIKRKDKEVGVITRVKVKKTKLTGKVRVVEFPIYYDYGVDDTGSCVNWLLEEKFWAPEGGTKNNPVVDTRGDFTNCALDKLITYIEEEKDRKEKLIDIVGECWRKVEDEIKTNRKPKYI